MIERRGLAEEEHDAWYIKPRDSRVKIFSHTSSACSSDHASDARTTAFYKYLPCGVRWRHATRTQRATAYKGPSRAPLPYG